MTFPDEELQRQRRLQAQEQLNVATGASIAEARMASNLLKAASHSILEGEEDLTWDEREEQAELRFRAIAKQVAKRKQWSRWESSKNFVE